MILATERMSCKANGSAVLRRELGGGSAAGSTVSVCRQSTCVSVNVDDTLNCIRTGECCTCSLCCQSSPCGSTCLLVTVFFPCFSPLFFFSIFPDQLSLYLLVLTHLHRRPLAVVSGSAGDVIVFWCCHFL